jgi:hypothetical protein
MEVCSICPVSPIDVFGAESSEIFTAYLNPCYKIHDLPLSSNSTYHNGPGMGQKVMMDEWLEEERKPSGVWLA